MKYLIVFFSIINMASADWVFGVSSDPTECILDKDATKKNLEMLCKHLHGKVEYKKTKTMGTIFICVDAGGVRTVSLSDTMYQCGRKRRALVRWLKKRKCYKKGLKRCNQQV